MPEKQKSDPLIKMSGYLSQLLFFSRLNVIDWMSRREMGWYLILHGALNILLAFLALSFIISYVRYFSFTYSHLRLPCRSKKIYFGVSREIYSYLLENPAAKIPHFDKSSL